MISDQEIFLLYGKNAVISRRGRFVFVHLDRPSKTLVRSRMRDFDPDEFFEKDCPICRMQRDSGVVVFDDSGYEDEQILLE
jgi:hypothetical protein